MYELEKRYPRKITNLSEALGPIVLPCPIRSRKCRFRPRGDRIGELQQTCRRWPRPMQHRAHGGSWRCETRR